GGHRLKGLKTRRLPAGGQQIVGEVGADAVALLVEGDQLHERNAEALGQAAVDLAFHDHRVDPDAAVVHGHHAPHLDLAGAAVDVDHHYVGAEGEGHVGRVVIGDALQPRLHALWQVGVGGEGQ